MTTGRTCPGSTSSGSIGNRPAPSEASVQPQKTIHLSHAGDERMSRRTMLCPGAQALLPTGDVPEGGTMALRGHSIRLRSLINRHERSTARPDIHRLRPDEKTIGELLHNMG